MAYKEFTIRTTDENNVGRLHNITDKLSAAGYPDASAYIAIRDASTIDHNYIIGVNPLYVGQLNTYNNNDYWFAIYRATLQFDNDLDIMINAPVEYAQLQLFKVAESGQINYNVVVQNGQPTYPHSPPVATDYNRVNYSGNGGELVNPSGSGWRYITLNEDGRSWIDISADVICKLCLRSSRDVDDVIPGTSVERSPYVNYNPIGYRPTLVIRVTLSIPVARTDEGTNKGVSSVTFNGEVTHSGYWIDSYGFEWKQNIGGDISSITVGTNKTRGLVFSYDKTGLSGTIYYRAWGENEAGKGYGEWKEISFKPTVTTQAVSNIDYDYAKGNGTIVSGSNITERGFEVKLEFSGSLGDYVFHSVAGFDGNVSLVTPQSVWEGTLVKTVSEENGFGLGAFTGDLARQPYPMFNNTLFECEDYKCRAWAENDIGKGYGDYVDFKTTCRPVGHQDDNTPPIYIPPPDEPIDITDDLFGLPDFPSIEIPEMPDGYWSGMFYYRKAYTKKDLDELRRKCRIFLDNSVEYALVLNHNMRVLQQFLNYMHTYLGIDEFNGFKDLIPTQHLNALAHEELNINDFKAIINNFISNSVNNTMNVNNNFRLVRNGLTDYTYTEDTGFIEEKVSTRIVKESNPDVEMLKKRIDRLSIEMSQNYATTQHNLYVVRSMIL